MCDFYNITIKKIVAETPFSNGLMERHKTILEEMLLKTCEEGGSSLEMFKFSLTMGSQCQKPTVERTWFFPISTNVRYEPKTTESFI